MSSSRAAGIGGIAFGALTFAGMALSRGVGGDYSAAAVARYLAPGHHAIGIASIFASLAGVLGLIVLLAHLQESLDERGGRVFWGAGVAAAACFALGAAVTSGQVVASTEGGVAIAPGVTYVISEVGAVMIFGAGAGLLGIALLTLALRAPATLPLRRTTALAGVCGLASLAWAPFFALLLWSVGLGARPRWPGP